MNEEGFGNRNTSHLKIQTKIRLYHAPPQGVAVLLEHEGAGYFGHVP